MQHSESNPGNENRRPVLCPPLPRLRAGVGHWAKKPLAATLCPALTWIGMPKIGYQTERTEEWLQLCTVSVSVFTDSTCTPHKTEASCEYVPYV